jgi:hypothetical protein
MGLSCLISPAPFWSDGAAQVVVIEGINTYGSIDPWTEILYSWEENGIKQQAVKDYFSFQCRYVLIKSEEL